MIAGPFACIFLLISIIVIQSRYSNGSIRWTTKLGDSCTDMDDCLAPFSECIDKKCTCMENFTQINDHCKPSIYDCPYKEPVKVNGTVKLCNAGITNQCGNNAFCFSHGYTMRTAEQSAIKPGHCCPTVASNETTKRVCPIGVRDPTTCTPESKESHCGDYNRYKCLENFKRSGILCCPTPCPSSRLSQMRLDWIVVNGSCH